MICDARRRWCTLQIEPEGHLLPIFPSDYLKLGYKIDLFQEAKKGTYAISSKKQTSHYILKKNVLAFVQMVQS